MKPLYFLLILLLTSCTVETELTPEQINGPIDFELYPITAYAEAGDPYLGQSVLTPDPDQVDEPCEFMWLRYHEKTVEIMKIEGANVPGDTIWVLFEHMQYGWINTYWIEGETTWDCLALNRGDNPLGFMVWFEGDTCTFMIPPVDELH